MSNQSTAPAIPASGRWFRIWPWLAVLLVLLLVGFIRVRLLELPLERDEGEYAYAGQLILQGIPPYELAYNMKLPGTYFAYAAGMSVFGETTSGIHLTLLAVNSLTCVFVFLLGRKLFGLTAGLVACASYALLSVSSAVLGAAAHATQFVVLFAVPGTLLLWQVLQTRKPRTLFFCGLLYGLAFVMKQQGICFGVFGFLLLLWRERSEPSGGSLKNISLYAAGTILPFAVICLYLACAGVFPQFWFWTFSYARTYAAGAPLGAGLEYLLSYLRNQFDLLVGFWILAGAGLVVALRKPALQKPLTFAVGFLFFSFLGTTPGLYFREHYFVLLLPALALTVGMAVQFLQAGSASIMKAAPALLFAAVMGWSLWVQRWVFFQFPPPMLSQIIYRFNPFVETITAARYIREHSAPSARIAVIGSEPQIYFYAHRHSATGFIYTYPLMENQPYAAAMQQQMISELEAGKPDYLVMVVNRYSWLLNESSDLKIIGWSQKYMDDNYQRVGIVAYPLGHPRVELWEEQAKAIPAGLQQYLAIYHRKPSAR